MGKQVRVTLSDGEMEFVSQVASRLGTTDSDVVQLGFRLGSDQLRSTVEALKELEPSTSIRALILRLISGEPIEDKELGRIAHDQDLPIDGLKKIRDCLTKNGEQKNVHARKS